MTKHIHFMGIGGSGASGVAAMASAAGFRVTGCDASADSPYSKYFKKYGVETQIGHSANHLIGVDTVVVSPALLFGEMTNPELTLAKTKNLQTWQEFLGKTLLSGKETMCVAGTHGKSTTTGLLALVLEAAGRDPSVMIGATVREWQANFRVGKGDLALVEADEFFNNFLSYSPHAIVLNNIEFDHPDFFKTEGEYWDSFANFVKQLVGDKVLVFNQDSVGIQKLFEALGEKVLSKLTLYGYTLGKPVIALENSTVADNIALTPTGTSFDVTNSALGISDHMIMKLSGLHNVSNALGVITLAKVYGIPLDIVSKVLGNFDGVGRRLELLSDKAGIMIYSDYGHHPTEISATLMGLRQKYPEAKLWCIAEPHSFSRTKALLADYKGVFNDADEVLIAPIFPARDTSDFGVSGADVVTVSGHTHAKYMSSFEEIVEVVGAAAKSGDVIVVMGAGKSYQLAEQVVAKLPKP